MVTILTDSERSAADAVVGDADLLLHDCRRAFSDGTRGEAFLLLLLARFVELHPRSYQIPRDKCLT